MKKVLVTGIFAIIAAVITGIFSYKAGADNMEQRVQNEIIQEVNLDLGSLSETLDYIINRNTELEKENKELEGANKELQDGVKQIQDQLYQLEKKYDELENDNLLNEKQVEQDRNNGDLTVDGIDFSQVSDILYDGERYNSYSESGNSSFSVGGKEYHSGFEIYTSRVLGMEDYGYIYFNLENKYSLIEFDVGRNKDSKCDAILLVTSSSGLSKEYELKGEIPSQHVEINVSGLGDLQIKLLCDYTIGFGFFNVKFYEN